MKNGDFDWDWDKSNKFELDGVQETLSEDKLSRRQYAEYLYYYLEKKGKVSNTVINLNAEWGAGKTYFLKRFYSSIKNVHPCVYIDAWKQDFSDDAFLTLFSSLSQQLQPYAGNLDARLIQCGQAIGRFTKGVIPEVLSSLIKTYSGLENVSDIAKAASQLMLKEHQEKMKGIQDLRNELAFWSRLAFENNNSKPIFIFIDELDRCRPNYAISLLEIVKHIFDIKNFVFIIATDTDQLQHSIKNVYGNDFSANDYLGRFFHRRFSLKAPKLKNLISSVVESSVDRDYKDISNNIYPITTELDHFIENTANILDSFNLNLRDAIRNIERLIDIMKSGLIKKKLDYIFLLVLMIIYDKDREIIDRQIGKLPITKTLAEAVKSSNYLKGSSQAIINLTLETRSQYIGVNYHFRGNQKYTASLPDRASSLYLHKYIELAYSFISEIPSLKDRIRKTGLNPLLTITSEPSGYEVVTYLQGAFLQRNDDADFYSFNNYVEFIELATSFD
ncbi:TPA: NTPase [Enterobacter hormaechei subsp. steigerwaltii]|nr:NTPase [Enterobacter hormaechei subsp. steigerwaltii]